MKSNIYASILFLYSTVFLAGCGGRVAAPVALENSFDSKLSCSHLNGEYSNNQKRLVELTGERKDKPIHNVGMLLTSPLFLDLSQAQKEEIQAIYDRNENITALMLSRECDMSGIDVPEPAEN